MSVIEHGGPAQDVVDDVAPAVDKTVEVIAKSVECRVRNTDLAEVRLRVRAKLAQFEHARVKTYVPILVERAVVRDLMAARKDSEYH